MRVRILFATCCVAALVGCQPAETGERLVLTAVTPAVLQSGRELVIRGAGFVPLRACAVTLAGRSHRAGVGSRAVKVALEGRARSSEELVALVEDSTLDALGSDGSFGGELRVSCAGGAGQARAAGVREVEFDFARARGRTLAERRALRARAEAWLADVGIEDVEVTAGTPGVVIGRVRAGSAAEAAYLAEGDVIARANGVGVYALGDLAAPPGVGEVKLRVQRGTREREVVLAAGVVATTAVSAARALRLCALCVGVLVCIVCFGPVPSVTIAFARVRSRFLHAHASREAHAMHASALALLLGALPISVAWFVLARVVAVAAARGTPVAALPPYLAFAAMGAAVALGSTAHGLRQRLRGAGAYVASAVVVGFVLVAACALAGTRSIEALVQAQGAWPWQWAVFQKPAALVGCVLYVVHAGSMLALPPGAGPLAQGTRPLGRLIVCGLGAAVFLGGWQSPFEALGPTLFVVKAWLFVALADLAQRAGVLGAARTAFGLAIVTVATAVALVVVPAPAFELGVGRVLFASALLIVACAAIQVARSAHPMGEPPTHPAPFA